MFRFCLSSSSSYHMACFLFSSFLRPSQVAEKVAMRILENFSEASMIIVSCFKCVKQKRYCRSPAHTHTWRERRDVSQTGIIFLGAMWNNEQNISSLLSTTHSYQLCSPMPAPSPYLHLTSQSSLYPLLSTFLISSSHLPPFSSPFLLFVFSPLSSLHLLSSSSCWLSSSSHPLALPNFSDLLPFSVSHRLAIFSPSPHPSSYCSQRQWSIVNKSYSCEVLLLFNSNVNVRNVCVSLTLLLCLQSQVDNSKFTMGCSTPALSIYDHSDNKWKCRDPSMWEPFSTQVLCVLLTVRVSFPLTAVGWCVYLTLAATRSRIGQKLRRSRQPCWRADPTRTS